MIELVWWNMLEKVIQKHQLQVIKLLFYDLKRYKIQYHY